MSSNKLSLLVNFIAVDKLSGALKNIIGLGKSGSQALNAMKGEGRQLESQLKKVRDEIARSSGNVTELIDRERQLERAIEQTNAQIQRRAALNRIDANAAAMRARGEALVARGQANIRGGAIMLAPLVLAGKAAADFSSGMVDIQQKATLTNAQMGQLQLTIQRISRDTAQFPEDVRAGLDVLLARGMKVGPATDAIRSATRLATAYRVDIPDASAAAFASITNLKVAARDTGRVFDAMAAAGKAGGFEIRDMARFFPALTAQMAVLGEEGVPAVADLSAALQVAMHTAGSADEAGNNIVNLLAKINSPGTIRAFEKNFGVDLPAAMKKLTDAGMSSLEAITLVTQRAMESSGKGVAFAFEDRQAQMGILAMIGHIEEYRDIRAQAMAADGGVSADFDQRMANDQGLALRALGAEMSNLVLAVSPVLLPFLREVTAMLRTGVGAITTWAQAHPGAASMLLKLVAGLAVAKIALGGLQMAFGGILGPMSTAYRYFARVEGISRFGRHLGLLKTGVARAAPVLMRGFTLMRTAALFLARGVMQAGLMLMANPVVLIIAAIIVAVGLLAYAIYTNWDTIKAAFNAGLAWISGAWTTLKGYFNTGVAAVKGVFSGLPGWLKTIGLAMMQGLLSSINPVALGARLISMAKNGIAAFKNYLGIKSPSRLFMALGGHMTQGLTLGIDRGGQRALGAMARLATGVTAAGALSLTPVATAAQSVARPARSGVDGTGGGGAPVTNFYIYQQPGEDAEDLARRIERILDRRAGVAARGSYEDGD